MKREDQEFSLFANATGCKKDKKKRQLLLHTTGPGPQEIYRNQLMTALGTFDKTSKMKGGGAANSSSKDFVNRSPFVTFLKTASTVLIENKSLITVVPRNCEQNVYRKEI